MAREFDGSIKIDTSLEYEEFKKGLKEVEKETEKSMDEVTEELDSPEVDSLTERINALKDSLTGAKKEAAAFKDDIVSGTADSGAVVDGLISNIQHGLAGMGITVSAAGAKIIAVVGGVAAGIAGIGFLVFKAFQIAGKIVQQVGQWIVQVFRTAVVIAKKLLEGVVQLVQVGLQALQRLANALISSGRRLISMAGQTEALSDSVSVLEETFNSLRENLVNLFLPQLQGIISWLVNLLNIINQVIAALSGQATYTKIVAKETEDAGAAAQEASGDLAAFDELDVLNQDTGGGGGAGGGFETIEEPIDSQWTALAETLLDYYEQIRLKVLELWNTLEPFRNFLNTTAIDFYNNFLLPVEEFVMGEGWDQFIATTERIMDSDWDGLNESLARFYSALSIITIAVLQGLLTFYDRFLAPIASWAIDDGLPTLLDGISDFAENVDWEYLNEQFGIFLDTLALLTIDILNIWLWFWENILVPLATWVVNEAIPRFFITFGTALEILHIVLLALKPLWDWFWTNVLLPILKWGGEKFLEFWDKLNVSLGKLKTWLENNPEKIRALFVLIAGLGAGAMLGLLLIVLALLSPLFLLGVLFLQFIGLVTVLIGWITLFVIELVALALILENNVRKAIQWVIDKWDELVEAFKEGGLKGALNVVIGWFESFLNKMIDGINSLIEKINSISFDFPSITIFGKTFGGGSFTGLGIPSIGGVTLPRLATGAVIPPNSEFAAILGDQSSGRNIETPEGLMRQIVQEELANSQQDIRVRFEGSLGALVRELQPVVERENRRRGTSLVEGLT